MGEADERLPAGPRGEQGETGERGQRGLSRVQGRAVAVLFLIGALAAVGNLFWTGHEVRAQTAARHRQGQMLEAKLCTTLGSLAALKPPTGDPAANPSRAFDQKLTFTLKELAPDLGCKGGTDAG